MPDIKIATYNLNNLFERPKIMELEGFSDEGRKVLTDVSKLNVLLENASYEGATGKSILEILEEYFHKQPSNPYFKINEIRGKLFSRKRDGSGLSLKAKGRKDWLGWVELIKQKTNEISLENTGRVVKAVNADILCTVEVDSRIALKNFNELVLKNFNVKYNHALLLDGNDDRGIDVGVLSDFEIESIITHIDDTYTDGIGRKQKIFSRDCPEYKIKIGNNKYIYLLCNHFKSKGYGSVKSSNAKRKKQADRVTEILDRYDMDADLVAVAGDFNDTPGSEPLKNLIAYPKLHDVLSWVNFQGPRWTYHTGNDQIDYLLVSKALFDRIKDVQIERRGIHKRGNISFPEVTNDITQASDHASVWATFNI